MRQGLGSDEIGIALLHVLLLMTMITAAAAGAAVLARVEVLVAYFHRSEREAAYAAQAILAAALRDLERAPDWNAILAGASQASFADGPVGVMKRIPGGGSVEVCCSAGSMTGRAQADSGLDWRPFAWHSLAGVLEIADAPRLYVVAWVVDDPEDPDRDAAADSNDRLLVRAEAAAPRGVRRALEVLVERAAMNAGSGTRVPGLRIVSWRELR